jgi:transcriptional antiterminator NusG
MAEVVTKNWYVIRAVSGQEAKIKDYIMSEISRLGYAGQVEDILVPMEKVVQIRNGKKINKEKVYFPGYIMIKANLTGEIPHIIKSVTNVIGFLGETKGGDPVPLRTSEVNRMLGKVDELTMTTEHIAIPFSRGENVKVIDGPFNGFNGSIEKVNEEKRKLEVMVKIFGRKTPLELSYMQVEKL